MTRKQESITLSLSLEHKAELEKLSLEFSCTWGNKPNVSGLMKAIAEGDILLSKADKPAKQKRALIKDAIASIQDALTILLELI
ncbi:MAG: hypothetical protein ACLBM6_00420 [Cuspidothrix sp.]